MRNLNQLKKRITKKDRELSYRESSKLLAEFFNGVVIKFDEEYFYD